MVMDVCGNGNIYTNYGLYTIIGEDDDKTSMCLRLCDEISKGRQLKFDEICGELGQILREDMRPVSEIQGEITRMKEKYFDNKKMIGIHIRSTDGGFVNIKWGEMVNKLISESKKWCERGGEYGIFLATDNAKYYVEFAAKIQSESQLVFYNPPKELCGTRSTNVDKFNNDKYNVLCGLIEMSLLGQCSEGVIGTAASTFSVCGMLMGYTRENEKKKYYLMESVADIPEFW
jgi:hypothetical protein